MRGEPEAETMVRYALRRRGIRSDPGRHHGTILPRSRAGRDALYRLLKRYSFRLFLRDLIQLRRGAALAELTHYCSLATAARFARALQDIGVARRGRAGKLVLRDQSVASFGPTLEWFVAEALQREYGIPTAWNLRPNRTAGGGDYDVIGVADGALIYVEVKSSVPRNIEQNQIGAFVDRVATLVPDLAILLNDTQLRMADKLIPGVRAELRRRPFGRGRIQRVHGEIFSHGDRLFITNSAPDLIGNLGICLERFFRARSSPSRTRLRP